MEIKTILIPVDGSEPAENAFRYGVGLAEENGATIVLLHVLDANETYYATNRVMLAGGMLDERKETAQRVMDQMKSQVPEGITCKTVIAAGVPGETACRTAKEENADLIVVGNSGKGAISSFVMGSVIMYTALSLSSNKQNFQRPLLRSFFYSSPPLFSSVLH